MATSSDDTGDATNDAASSNTAKPLPRSPEVTAPFQHDENGDEATKEERDVAFAVAVLQSRILGERQLTRALTNWTIHSSKTLREHLQGEKLLTDEESSRLTHQAAAASSAELRQDGSRTKDPTHERARQALGIAQLTMTAAASEPRTTEAKYSLLRPFGKGGMGSVWLARDESLNRLVAIKEVGESAARSPAAEARFRREAEVTGQLEHPNIVPVYQYGRDAKRDQPFYVMRFVGKKTFADAISEYHARRAEGLADAVELHRLLNSYLSVCQAIAFAHSRDILHRDLKPENVALGNFGEVIVLDWGLAKRVDEAELGDAGAGSTLSGSSIDERTTAGQVLGTPHYMSPEQASGRIDNMDVRTDVYGLGAILFSILTGYAPHEASQTSRSQSGRSVDLYASIVENPTPRVHDTDQDAPAVLDAICAKAMARTPAARYQSATDLADDIQCWMAGEPVSAYQEKWDVRMSRWIKQRSLVQWLVALLGVGLMVTSIFVFSAMQSKRMADQANLNALQLDGGGLSAHLMSEVQEAMEDVRFMANVPPIQAIIRTRYPQDSTELASDAVSADGEDVWRTRLETIFTGLVTAKTEYVSAAYISIGSDQSADSGDEIVRVERNRMNRGFVRTTAQRPLSAAASDFSRLLDLKAGDIHIADIEGLKPLETMSLDTAKDATPELAPARAPLTLAMSVPIFDELSGKLFGAVVLTVDIEFLLSQAVDAAGQDHIQLADPSGRVLADYQPGDAFRGWGPGTSEFVDLPESFLKGTQLESAQYPNANAPHGRYAVRIPLDPTRSNWNYILVLEGSSSTR